MGGLLNLDGGTLTLDGGTRPPYNLSTTSGSDVKVVEQLSYVNWIVCLFCVNTFRNTSTWVVLKWLLFYFYSSTFFDQYFVLYFK